MFGLGGTGVHDNLVVKQGNQTLNDKHEPPMQEEPRSECKKTHLTKKTYDKKDQKMQKTPPIMSSCEKRNGSEFLNV